MTQPMVRHGGRTSKISKGSGVMTQGFSVTTHVLVQLFVQYTVMTHYFLRHDAPCTTFVLWCVTTHYILRHDAPCTTIVLWCVTTQDISVMTHPCTTFVLWCVTTQDISVMTERRHPRRPVATLGVRHDAPMVRHDARLAVCQ